MLKRVTKTCLECGVQFDVIPSQAEGRKWCSMVCRRAGEARTLTTQICPACEKPFSFHPSVYKNGRVHCSKACEKTTHRVTANCLVCGKEFWHLKNAPHQHCSADCAIQTTARKNKGRENTWLRGEQPTWQNRVDLTCEQCKKVFRVEANLAKNGRRFCTKKCMAKWQETTITGENNFNWRGGHVTYYGRNWLQQRRNARRRDNYTCQRCGAMENTLFRQLDVHHIIPFKSFGVERYKEANALSNLISLCLPCHLAIEHEQDTR